MTAFFTIRNTWPSVMWFVWSELYLCYSGRRRWCTVSECQRQGQIHFRSLAASTRGRVSCARTRVLLAQHRSRDGSQNAMSATGVAAACEMSPSSTRHGWAHEVSQRNPVAGDPMPIDAIIRVSFESRPQANQAVNSALVASSGNRRPGPFSVSEPRSTLARELLSSLWAKHSLIRRGAQKLFVCPDFVG